MKAFPKVVNAEKGYRVIACVLGLELSGVAVDLMLPMILPCWNNVTGLQASDARV